MAVILKAIFAKLLAECAAIDPVLRFPGFLLDLRILSAEAEVAEQRFARCFNLLI